MHEVYLCKYSKDLMEHGLLYLLDPRGHIFQSKERTEPELLHCNAPVFSFPQNIVYVARDESSVLPATAESM